MVDQNWKMGRVKWRVSVCEYQYNVIDQLVTHVSQPVIQSNSSLILHCALSVQQVLRRREWAEV